MTDRRVVAATQLPESVVAMLRAGADLWVPPDGEPLDGDAMHAVIAGAAVVLTVPRHRVDGAFFDAAGPQLRGVAQVAVGHDNVDLAEASRRGVQITNTPGVLTEATADLAMSLILSVTRRLGEAERLIRAGTPWPQGPRALLGAGLQGKTLGTIGLGAIGSATARRARACGMSIAYATDLPADPAVVAELEARELPLDELAATADVLSVHCPLNEATVHLVDRALLARMKPTAFLVNTARGPIVEEEALVEALRAGSIAGAALDVYEHEPAIHPGLLEHENVVLMPHIGSATVETRAAMADLAARNALAVLDGRRPLTPVNDLSAPGIAASAGSG